MLHRSENIMSLKTNYVFTKLCTSIFSLLVLIIIRSIVSNASIGLANYTVEDMKKNTHQHNNIHGIKAKEWRQSSTDQTHARTWRICRLIKRRVIPSNHLYLHKTVAYQFPAAFVHHPLCLDTRAERDVGVPIRTTVCSTYKLQVGNHLKDKNTSCSFCWHDTDTKKFVILHVDGWMDVTGTDIEEKNCFAPQTTPKWRFWMQCIQKRQCIPML